MAHWAQPSVQTPDGTAIDRLSRFCRTRGSDQQTDAIRYDTRCYFNVRSKADISQLNLPQRNEKKQEEKNEK